MATPINNLILEGKTYVVLPRDLVEREAPQLLESTQPAIDSVPARVVYRHQTEGISMIKAWREHLGFTQQEVADRMGVSQNSYHKTENSKRPRKSTREAVAKAFGIPYEQL